MSSGQNKRGMWLLVLYLPMSCVIVGFLGNLLRLAVPFSGRQVFIDVFWNYALRFPNDFSILRWVAPALGWLILLLMLVAIRTRKPILTLAEIRIILLVLIVLFTLFAKIFLTVLVVSPGADPGSYYDRNKNLIVFLFLFVDVDLILVLLASYLPIFNSLRRRLV